MDREGPTAAILVRTRAVETRFATGDVVAAVPMRACRRPETAEHLRLGTPKRLTGPLRQRLTQAAPVAAWNFGPPG